MKRFSQQLHTKAQSVKLQAAEKRELRERLVSYMEYHPLPADIKAAGARASTTRHTPALVTDVFTTVSIPFALLFKSSAVAAALVLIVVPFLAEQAMPGDTLYAVKVQFTEELRSTLTFDTYQKVEWETERLNRRIAEARLLASEGRLTEAVEAEVAQAVKTHTENAQKEIDILRTQDVDGATIASIALNTTLEVQSNSLRGEDGVAMTTVENLGRSTDLIANAIDQSRSSADLRNASSTIPAYDKLMARVEQNTTRAYELLNSVSGSAASPQLVEINRRIEDIERSIEVAITLADEDEMAARTTLVAILQRTQRVILFMTELQAASGVDIESVVPVVLTEAEMELAMQKMNMSLQQELQAIEILLPTVTDADISGKAVASVELLTQYTAQLATTTEYTAFMNLGTEALALAQDTKSMITQSIDRSLVENEVGLEVTSGTTTEQAVDPSTSSAAASSTDSSND